MTITITVSDKLFGHDVENRFQNFFDRLIVDIAGNISDDDNLKLCGRYELETATLLKVAFKHGQYFDESKEDNK